MDTLGDSTYLSGVMLAFSMLVERSHYKLHLPVIDVDTAFSYAPMSQL